MPDQTTAPQGEPDADKLITLQLARAVWQASHTRSEFKDDEARRTSWDDNKKNAMMLARKIIRQLDKHDIMLSRKEPGT